MKKLIIPGAIAVALIATFVQIQAKVAPEHFVPGPVFKWESIEHDFGRVEKGVPVTHEFTFTNTGDVPLIISSAKASCGCTVAGYTKEPIPVGGEGTVTASYDAKKEGAFNKTVTVTANTENGTVVLKLKGEVISE